MSMPDDRFSVQTGRRRTPLLIPEGIRKRANALVHRASGNPNAPFERMVDFWFASVGWAVAHDLQPVDVARGHAFNSVAGPHASAGDGSANHLTLDDWQLTLLNVLFLRDHEGFLEAKDGKIDLLDIYTGRQSKDGQATSKSAIIENANRYALAGAEALCEALRPSAKKSIGEATMLTSANELLVTYGIGAEKLSARSM